MFANLIYKIDTDTSEYGGKIDIRKFAIGRKYEILLLSEFEKMHDSCVFYFNLEELSNVVFSDDKNYACIYISYHCGENCGQGDYVLLKKEKNKWRIVEVVRTWIT